MRLPETERRRRRSKFGQSGFARCKQVGSTGGRYPIRKGSRDLDRAGGPLYLHGARRPVGATYQEVVAATGIEITVHPVLREKFELGFHGGLEGEEREPSVGLRRRVVKRPERYASAEHPRYLEHVL